MKSDPVLRRLETQDRMVTAFGGLHMHRGNDMPYFSLTGEVREKSGGGWWSRSGCVHEDLVQAWPELKQLADLHLSGIDGAPMHAEANGYYWIAGAVGGVFGSKVDGGYLGQKYHGGSGGYGRSPDECLAIVARHFRVSEADAIELVALVRLAHYAGRSTYGCMEKAGKARLHDWIEAQRPRWKSEADKCRADLGLVVYGDPYLES